MGFGFNVARDQDGKTTFYATHGEMHVSTTDGVLYDLYFGEPVQGDEKAIEIGTPPSKPDKTKDDNAASTDNAAKNGDEAKSDDQAHEDKTKSDNDDQQKTDADKDKKESTPDVKNRYLMVDVRFDTASLGAEPVKPTEPVEPKKPDGYVPAEPTKPDTDQAAKPAETDKPAESKDEPAPTPPQQERPPEFVKYDEAIKEYTLDKQHYELDLEKYNTDLADYNTRKEEGEKVVKQLTNRFAPWLYVITGSNLQSFQIPLIRFGEAKGAP